MPGAMLFDPGTNRVAAMRGLMAVFCRALFLGPVLAAEAPDAAPAGLIQRA
jgi:hypothetical protein